MLLRFSIELFRIANDTCRTDGSCTETHEKFQQITVNGQNVFKCILVGSYCTEYNGISMSHAFKIFIVIQINKSIRAIK